MKVNIPTIPFFLWANGQVQGSVLAGGWINTGPAKAVARLLLSVEALPFALAVVALLTILCHYCFPVYI